MPRTSPSASSVTSRRRRTARNEANPTYQAKRLELLQVAADVFREVGYERATLNDIAERFGTDRAAIYYYAANKKELLQAIFRDVVSDVLEENARAAEEILLLDLNAPEKLHRLVELQLMSYENNYPYVYIYIREDKARLEFKSSSWARNMVRKTEQFEKIVIRVLELGIAEGTIRNDVPAPMMANVLFGMINWTHRWLKPGARKINAEKTIDAFYKLFTDGALYQES
ncbi:MAG: TetR/AcrR family transcriptional regulator [Alcaligenaceae bacterium]|nr:MAG: TetR/AcrR family transcriptional regulator [Alcaligenaceae bacterium]